MDITAEELAGWIAEGEGRRLEFKRGLPREGRVARSLCAFANTKGGILLVGVTDHRTVFGVPDPNAVIARLRTVAADYLVPPVQVELRAVAIEGEHVVCCSVPLSPQRPHVVRHRDGREETVVRVGSSNRVAEGPTLRALARSPKRGGLDALERQILAWLTQGEKRGSTAVGATVAAFGKAHNVGLQRARRAFVHLEREGHIVGHGRGARREYGVV